MSFRSFTSSPSAAILAVGVKAWPPLRWKELPWVLEGKVLLPPCSGFLGCSPSAQVSGVTVKEGRKQRPRIQDRTCLSVFIKQCNLVILTANIS